MPNQLGGDYCTSCPIFKLSRVRTELQMLWIVITLPPHPVEADGQSAGHRQFSDGSLATLAQMDIATSPAGVSANGGLRWLAQQVTDQRTALLGDVLQSPARGAAADDESRRGR
jgi:hypothetical protein